MMHHIIPVTTFGYRDIGTAIAVDIGDLSAAHVARKRGLERGLIYYRTTCGQAQRSRLVAARINPIDDIVLAVSVEVADPGFLVVRAAGHCSALCETAA